MKYASIDVGTNTVLLLIVDGADRVVDVLDISTITRLGEGLEKKGRLSDEAMVRTFQALKRYSDIIEENQVNEVICVGTSALREAENSHMFLDMVKERLNFSVRIISERDEAYYTYLSVRMDESLGSIADKNVVIIDIGGGSTEIIKGDGEGFSGFTSLPVGTVKLTEMFVRHDPPLETELAALIDHVKGLFQFPFYAPESNLIGTGGTITNLASIILGLEVFEKQKIHDLRVGLQEIETMIDAMKRMNNSERRALKGMEQGREDIILQGIIFLREIMVYFGIPDLIVSAKGVRYGVVYEKFRDRR